MWFVVDEYYCSETTTTQACIGYVSLGLHRATTHSADRANQPEIAVRCLPCLLYAHLNYMYMYIHVYLET